MRKSDLAEDQAPRGAAGIAGRQGGAGWGVALLAGMILLETAWRLWLGGEFLFDATVPGRSVTLLHWRMLDQFAGWLGLCLLILAAGRPMQGFPAVLRVALRWVVAAGVAAVALGAVGGGTIADFAGLSGVVAAGLLAVAAVLLTWRLLADVAKGMRSVGGMTIEQLCGLVSVQWLLVWVAAEVFLRIKLRQTGGVESEDAARSLLFALPAFGFLPNVMMALQIRWWGSAGFAGLQPPGAAGGMGGAVGGIAGGQVRVRAWIVGLLAVNAGAVGLVLSEPGRWRLGWLGAAGAVSMVLGLAIYALGFDRSRRRARGATAGGGGWMVLAGLVALAVGILMAAGERLMGEGVLREFSAAWRFLMVPGATVLWLAGMGREALTASVAPRLRSPAAETAAAALVLLGVFLTAGVFLLAVAIDRQWLEAVGFGGLLLFLGIAVACAVALRGRAGN